MKKLIWILSFCLMLCLRAEETPVTVFSFPKSGTHYVKEIYYQLMQKRITHDHPHHYLPDFRIDKLANIYASQKIVFLLRDPRDALISYVHWIDQMTEQADRIYWGSSFWDNWSINRKIEEVIMGIRIPYMCFDVQFLPLLEKELMKWNNVLIVRFEDLIGPKGGGREDAQIATVQKLAKFMSGYSLSSEEAQFIADAAFGQPGTFYNPSIGKWKNYFSHRHKQLFKNTIWGEVLIALGYENNRNW